MADPEAPKKKKKKKRKNKKKNQEEEKGEMNPQDLAEEEVFNPQDMVINKD